MENDICFCGVYTICPSPSSHHSYCLNNECKKMIGKMSYQGYLSLDALVPVWEKLEIGGFKYIAEGIEFILIPDFYKRSDIIKSGKTIQEAAAIATAKAINDINP